ncbi:hypothetical protein ABG768_005261 [Culter alburnus]|uniref:Uncharacterized protein n=1 Tax=Culter alburnus TaxID=194366 RepID=A0AAW1ZRW6_CULAL
MHLLNTCIDVTEKLTDNTKYLKEDCYLQNGWTLDEYAEGCLQLYSEARWDDETLKHLFWSRMDEIFSKMLLLRDNHCTFAEFVDYTLWLCGSSLTLGVIENDAL